jgi:hypothetical protein
MSWLEVTHHGCEYYKLTEIMYFNSSCRKTKQENSHTNNLLMAAPKKQLLYFVMYSAKMDEKGRLHVPAALLPEVVLGYPRGHHIRPRCCTEQKNTRPY